MTQDNPLVVEALSGSVAVEYQPPVSFGNACIGDLQQLTRCMSFMKSPELEFFEDELILRDSQSEENPTLSIKHVLPEACQLHCRFHPARKNPRTFHPDCFGN